MRKKVVLSVVFSLAWFLSPLSAWTQYRAEDISVPPGYKVIKVAESNRIAEPFRMTFDSSGNILAGSFGFAFYKVDPEGEIGILGITRKYKIVPAEVEPAPDGTYTIRSLVYDVGKEIYRFTPPDTNVKVLAGHSINAIGYDRRGNFYAEIQETSGTNPVIIRYDSEFRPVETALEWTGRRNRDFAFDSQNNLFVLQVDPTAAFPCSILEVPAGSNGIPGPEDAPSVFASGLAAATNIAIDVAGNIYTDAFVRNDIDGFSSNRICQLERTDRYGNVTGAFGPELPMVGGLVCRDGFIYVSEWPRNAVTRIDLATGDKSGFTRDFGLVAPGPVAFDVDDTLYTHVFREYRLVRMNSDKTFSQVGEGTGYAQTIASDGAYFYLGSSPSVGSNGNQILKIDPISGTTEVVAKKLKGWRSVTFDAYGRLILCSIINELQNQFTADIIDLGTGIATPYVTGLHNKGRGLAFDGRQNVYAVEGIGDGIKKVPFLENVPRDISSEPLYYDLRPLDPVPPTIYYIAVNGGEEVFIPRIDTGDVLMGDIAGNIDYLARGLINPTHVTIDKYGALFISDSGNGIFKIVHARWTIPAVIMIKDALLAEVRASPLAHGIKNSLVSKLENVDKRLAEFRVAPAIGQLKAFCNEVNAQAGKEIPVDLASRWITSADKIIRALMEIE